MKAITDLLLKAASDRFWGQIQLDFRDGEVSLVRKTETIKLENRRGNNRDDHSSQPR